jgi:hypothetical protein
MKYLFLLIMLFACAEIKPKTYPEVDKFVSTWSEDYGPFTPLEVRTFHQYLTSVQDFYDSQEMSSKFPHYLSSMNNNFQLLAHLEMNLPARFKKYYRHWPVRKSPNYLRYEREQSATLRARLEKERDEHLKQELGSEKFNELQNRALKFDRKGVDFKINL